MHSHDLTPGMRATAVLVDVILILFWIWIFGVVLLTVYYKIKQVKKSREIDKKIFKTVEEFRDESDNNRQTGRAIRP